MFWRPSLGARPSFFLLFCASGFPQLAVFFLVCSLLRKRHFLFPLTTVFFISRGAEVERAGGRDCRRGIYWSILEGFPFSGANPSLREAADDCRSLFLRTSSSFLTFFPRSARFPDLTGGFSSCFGKVPIAEAFVCSSIFWLGFSYCWRGVDLLVPSSLCDSDLWRQSGRFWDALPGQRVVGPLVMKGLPAESRRSVYPFLLNGGRTSPRPPLKEAPFLPSGSRFRAS